MRPIIVLFVMEGNKMKPKGFLKPVIFSLVLALLQVGGHPPKVGPELLEQVRELEGDYVFETYFSLSCQNCPDVVQALNLMAVLNPGVTHVAIDGAVFPEEVKAREVMAVPSVFLNGEPFAQGLVNYASGEVEQIRGCHTGEIAARLGYKDYDEVVHRDNLVVFA
jgi:alkyl hydroperoxide reductase subunit AhpF